MRDEITTAVVFLARLIERSKNFDNSQLKMFKRRLSELLAERFENHWFPEKPDKGQGYRCIRVNSVNRKDPTLEKAAIACGFKYEDMKLPYELTVWVDPNEVVCRFGETKGSFCTISFSDKEISSLLSCRENNSNKNLRIQKSNTSGSRNFTIARKSRKTPIPQQPKQMLSNLLWKI